MWLNLAPASASCGCVSRRLGVCGCWRVQALLRARAAAGGTHRLCSSAALVWALWRPRSCTPRRCLARPAQRATARAHTHTHTGGGGGQHREPAPAQLHAPVRHGAPVNARSCPCLLRGAPNTTRCARQRSSTRPLAAPPHTAPASPVVGEGGVVAAAGAASSDTPRWPAPHRHGAPLNTAH
jgi:hypothetical protein